MSDEPKQDPRAPEASSTELAGKDLDAVVGGTINPIESINVKSVIPAPSEPTQAPVSKGYDITQNQTA